MIQRGQGGPIGGHQGAGGSGPRRFWFFVSRPEAEEDSGGPAEGEAEDASSEAPVAVRWEPKLPREPKNRELAQFLQRCDPKRRVGVDAF